MLHPNKRVANPPRVSRTERLEGSRFVAWQLYGLVAGGSRERLEVWQFYGPVVSAAQNRRDGQNIALGHSSRVKGMPRMRSACAKPTPPQALSDTWD